MKINVMSVMVDDQAKALRFYTGVLGFVKKPGTRGGMLAGAARRGRRRPCRLPFSR